MHYLKRFYKNKYLIPVVLSILFFILGVNTLANYGINWDAPSRMLRGQAYIQYLLTGKVIFNGQNGLSPMLIKPNEQATRFDMAIIEDIAGATPVVLPERPIYTLKAPDGGSFYRHSAWSTEYWLTHDDGHPAIGDIIAALSNKVLFTVLKLLPDIASYQIIYLAISAIGVFVVSLFAYEISRSRVAALVAGLSLALFPLFFSEAHFNMKDPLQASLFAGSIWSFWHFVKEKKRKILWGLLFSFFVIFALGIKWNAIFLPFIILPWLFTIRRTIEFKNLFSSKNLKSYGLIVIISFIFLSIAFLPYTFNDFPTHISRIITFYVQTGTLPDPIQPLGFITPGGFNIYPLALLLTQTPEVILFLAILGSYLIIKKRGGELKVGYLLLLWLLIPVLRISLPHIWFYNGLRQIIEVVPVLAILAGIGVAYLISVLKLKKIYLKLLVVIFIFMLLVIPIVRLHPNENLYFNTLAGGLGGAKAKGLVDKKITYGNIYKQAANWLNENAPKNSNVAHLDGTMFALSPMFLREDISISPYHFSGLNQKGEYILNLYDEQEPTLFSTRYIKNFLKPIYRIDVDGTNMLTIYKNDPNNLLKKAGNEKKINEIKIQREGTDMQIDLGKVVRVTKIALRGNVKNCTQPYGQFIDEFVEFIDPQSESVVKYDLQERKAISKVEVDFLYAAEPARFIKISPQSQFSCFNSATIAEITYLQ